MCSLVQASTRCLSAAPAVHPPPEAGRCRSRLKPPVLVRLPVRPAPKASICWKASSRRCPLPASRRRWKGSVVCMDPDEEKMTRRSPLDFPMEWERLKPARRPDIFPQFIPMKTPLPAPLPEDPPEEDEEEDEEEEEKKEEEEEDPDKEEPEKPEQQSRMHKKDHWWWS